MTTAINAGDWVATHATAYVQRRDGSVRPYREGTVAGRAVARMDGVVYGTVIEIITVHGIGHVNESMVGACIFGSEPDYDLDRAFEPGAGAG